MDTNTGPIRDGINRVGKAPYNTLNHHAYDYVSGRQGTSWLVGSISSSAVILLRENRGNITSAHIFTYL